MTKTELSRYLDALAEEDDQAVVEIVVNRDSPWGNDRCVEEIVGCSISIEDGKKTIRIVGSSAADNPEDR